VIFKNVLVLAPHTDDAELGCGGTIARLVGEGVRVHVAAFSTAEESLPAGWPKDTLKKEFLEAIPKLGVPSENLHVYDFPVRKLSYSRQEVLEELVQLRRALQPDTVFIPSCNDLHQDHQVVHAEGMRAFKDISVMGYELPWNHVAFSAQAFIRLDKSHLDLKWLALNCYKSQLENERLYFTEDFIYGLARVRGTMVKSLYAEAFEVLRLRL
jgi:LmbE family N-acetylglucosaminyl deacetylase